MAKNSFEYDLHHLIRVKIYFWLGFHRSFLFPSHYIRPWTTKKSKLGDGLLLLFSCYVISNSLWPHGLQSTTLVTLLCLPLSQRVCWNSCPLTWWCYWTISCSATPFLFCLQSFPESRYFQMSQLFASRGQSIGISTSTSVLPMNIQDWFPLGWTGWITL